MFLSEALNLCSSEQEVRVIIGKDFAAPTVTGEAEALSAYLCAGVLEAEVIGIGTDDGATENSLMKIWLEGMDIRNE